MKESFKRLHSAGDGKKVEIEALELFWLSLRHKLDASFLLLLENVGKADFGSRFLDDLPMPMVLDLSACTRRYPIHVILTLILTLTLTLTLTLSLLNPCHSYSYLQKL